ncbi:hypothetical protein TL16_g04302 [Triparma laevis f. inornata]|uniref:DCD domain-containing protein n=1 Tax=Triparma laevis f. inornata TaxID=1714386 RepID=A0A9W7A502_9STRA|nr:hypothetical protein TL16_g04302 [Triparma laevis f. inornata]
MALFSANDDTTNELDNDFLAFPSPTSSDSDSDSSDCSTNSTAVDPSSPLLGLPPWLSSFPSPTTHPLTRLHNEILQFTRLLSPTTSDLSLRDGLVSEIDSIIQECFDGERETVVFGSMSTGLLLPGSDIDLVCLVKEKEGGEEENVRSKGTDTSILTQSPMRLFADSLHSAWGDSLTYLEVLEHTRIPLVKCTHGPTNISVDVSFDIPNGPIAGKLMRRFLTDLPPLRPLTMVLKQFLKCRNLNEPYKGGVGAFMVQLMVVSFLQQRSREDKTGQRYSNSNLGSLLLDFLELYGLNFNYITTGISVEGGGVYFPKAHDKVFEEFFQMSRPMSLSIENPLEGGMDVGKGSFRIGLIKKAFEVNFKILLSNVTSPVSPPVSILATIIPPEKWMGERSVGEGDYNLERWIELPENHSGAANGATNGAAKAVPKKRKSRDEEEQQQQKQNTCSPPKEINSKKRRKRAVDLVSSDSDSDDSEEGEEKSETSSRSVSSSALSSTSAPSQQAPPPPPPPPQEVIDLTAPPPPRPSTLPPTNNNNNGRGQTYRIFTCNNSTEGECLKLRLFGAPSDNTKCAKGAILFLYNFEAKHMLGPFEADSESRWNINPKAWKGRFKYQVMIKPVAGNSSDDLRSNTVKIPKGRFDEKLRGNKQHGKGRNNKVPTRLDEDEGWQIMKLAQRLGWRVPQSSTFWSNLNNRKG